MRKSLEKKNDYNYDTTNTSGSTVNTPKPPQSGTDSVNDAWADPDTIHYLSPATTRTLCEGDFDYTRFIPDFNQFGPPTFSLKSSISCDDEKWQRTLAIIKPEAMGYKDVVLRTIVESGLVIVSQRTVHLTPEQVAEIYTQYYGCPGFPNMVVSMSMGPLLALSMAGVNAVDKWKTMIGPSKAIDPKWFLPLSVRTRFGLQEEIPDVLHASDNVREANKENRYFYPQSVLEPIITEQIKVEDYVNLYIKHALLNGLVELVQKRPLDPIIFLAEWLLCNNPFQPVVPYQYAMAPT